MRNNLLKAMIGLPVLSFMLFACQKDLEQASIDTQIQQDAKWSDAGTPMKLVSSQGMSFGSTTGPGSDLYVPEALSGTILRIDPKTGDHTIFASGLPQMIPEAGFGGVSDLVFIGQTAYALVTLVDDPNFFPTGQVNGIYRIDNSGGYTIIADIGAFNLANPPTGFAFEVATGVSYSIQTFRDGFLVTDGHLNRVLYVSKDGEISIAKQFNNIVPTGLDVQGNHIYMSQAGPVPHDPAAGKVVSLNGTSGAVSDVASGAPLIVDVESGRGQTLFALSQGDYSGEIEGSPALPNTGALVKVNANSGFDVVADGLDRPTSLEIIGNTAYIITLEAEVWTIDNITSAPFGRQH